MEYDVTSLVEGDGTYTFVLAMTSDDDAVADNVVFTSRESAQPPQLVITADGPAGTPAASGPDSRVHA